MKSHLYKLFEEIAVLNEKMRDTPSISENTLEIRFRGTLENKQLHLPKVLSFLENNDADSQEAAESLFIIYQADEAGSMQLNGWVRESDWMGEKERTADFQTLAAKQTDNLKKAAPLLKEPLGSQYKYFIPFHYR